VHQIIRTLGNEPGFVAINIYNKTGEIIFSTDSSQVGTEVDLRAEACVICHASDSPLVSVPTSGRVRVYEAADGGRILGLINPIRNEQECSSAACHAHAPEQMVLGVLDVKLSLAVIDERVAASRRTLIASAFLMTLLVAGASGLFIYRVVGRPIRKLSDGMQRISSGDLDARIAIVATDEIGQLAQRFNRMAQDLKVARAELQEWGSTLEERVEDKTEELRRAQSQIIHMEKMASLGKLSASVAHEINNPLFGILTYAKLLLRELPPDADGEQDNVRRYVSIIEEESSRCGEIVKGLLDFARQSGGEFAPHHVHEIIEKTLILLRHHFEMQQIVVTAELHAGDDEIVCDAKQLQQAIIAPCINAVEAMPQGGSLTVRTTEEGDEVAIDIIDTGVGIPENVLSHIFEPFFTTKEGQAGLGLGLAVAYGIVHRHRGRIDVESAPDKGTRFRITLPRNPMVEAAGAAAEETA
jgi:two-component system NtrC family sensor kinase